MFGDNFDYDKYRRNFAIVKWIFIFICLYLVFSMIYILITVI